MIKAGEFRHRLRIEMPVITQDSTTGEPVTAWQFYKTVWGKIAPLSARDFIAAQAGQSQITARITIRALAGLRPDMRIVHKNDYYNIEGILPDADSGQEYMTLPVSAGIREG